VKEGHVDGEAGRVGDEVKKLLVTTWLGKEMIKKAFLLPHSQEGSLTSCLEKEVVGLMAWRKSGEATL
jgi:hypothetical protein